MTYESRTINQAGQKQLDVVAALFEEWRQQKTSKSARIPEALLHEAQKRKGVKTLSSLYN